jgi:hypothetical protein
MMDLRNIVYCMVRMRILDVMLRSGFSNLLCGNN